jgi:hypothetical protein
MVQLGDEAARARLDGEGVKAVMKQDVTKVRAERVHTIALARPK